MQARSHTRRNVTWVGGLLAVLVSLGLSGCSDEPKGEGGSSGDTVRSSSAHGTAQDDSSAYFSDAVVTAWEKAGAEAGWIIHHDDGQFTFKPDAPNSMFLKLKASKNVPMYLPGFRIDRWQDGMTADLPAPKIGFGLYLYSSGIQDSGLKELARFGTLRSLNFYQGRITDKGVKELTALEDLRALSLYNTDLTDAAAQELAKIETLEFLDLGGANVRISGGSMFQLQQALPNCTVFRRH